MKPILKVFYSQHGGEKDIEEQFAKFLDIHPEYAPTKVSSCCYAYGTIVVVLFEQVRTFLPNFLPKDGGIIPLKQTEITCEDKDPWNGEFIPVGDPPKSRPGPVRYDMSSRNPAEQFGGGIH